MCHFDVTVEEGGAAPLRFLLFWFAVNACVRVAGACVVRSLGGGGGISSVDS